MNASSLRSHDTRLDSDRPMVLDPIPGHFYVSVTNGARVSLLSGPYGTHGRAVADVTRIRKECEKWDGWSHFYAFGTSRWDGVGEPPPGLLQRKQLAEFPRGDGQPAIVGEG